MKCRFDKSFVRLDGRAAEIQRVRRHSHFSYQRTYANDDLDARWKVQVADTALIIDRPTGASYRVYREFEDRVA